MGRNKDNLIGVKFTVLDALKDRYRKGVKEKPMGLSYVEIVKNKKYGAVAKITHNASITELLSSKLSKKDRAKLSEKMKKMSDSNKRTDTSKWVKPDEHSIRDELIVNLFMLELLKEDWWETSRIEGRAEICFSILHSTSPKNPQTLTNFAMADCNLVEILKELKSPIADERMRISFHNYKKKGVPRKKWFKGREHKLARKMYKQYVEKLKNNMIKIKGDKK